MARFDTVVKDGLVVIPYVGQLNIDIGIRDGRIAALEDRIETSDADEVIDAAGKVVLPGGVDTHFHLGIYRDMAQDTESETTSSTGRRRHHASSPTSAPASITSTRPAPTARSSPRSWSAWPATPASTTASTSRR